MALLSIRKGYIMAFGRKSKDESTSATWTLETGFNSPWKLDRGRSNANRYVLAGRSAETYGWLNMTLTIDRSSGSHSVKAAWNDAASARRNNAPTPKPVKIGKLKLTKGTSKKTLDV